MSRRQVLAGLALFLALFVVASGFVQAAPLALAPGGGPVRSTGFGLADFWSSLQWLLGFPAHQAQLAALPKEGGGIDPNGSPKPSPPPDATTNSGSSQGTSASSGKHGGKH
jgi:hypothetical protein